MTTPSTPIEEREAIAQRALAELQDMSENWSVETSLAQMAAKIADAPKEKRAQAIEAISRLAFEEGFYRAAISRPDSPTHLQENET